MSTLLNRRFVPKDTMLIHENDEAHTAFFVENGVLEVFRTTRGGKEQRISTIGPGEIAGEMAFFGADENTRTASVRVLEPATIITLGADNMKAMMDALDKPARALFKIMLDRTKRGNDQLIGRFTSVQHLNEMSKMTVDHIRREMKSGEERDEFDETVLPKLNDLIIAMRDFERMRQAAKGL